MFKQDIEGLNKHREQTIRDIKDLLQDNKRVACVRYTGYGKSYYIVRKLIEDVSGKVIIVVPNDTLKIHYEEQYKDNDKVIILTYQIIKNKTTDYIQQTYKGVSLIIADECHHITATKWTKEFQRLEKETNANVLGLTATPEKIKDCSVVDTFFNGVQVEPLNLLDGISLGFVPKIKYIVAYASLDDKQDIIDNKMTEVDRYKISNLLNVENIIGKYITEEYLEDNLKILVFVSRIEYIEEARAKVYNWFNNLYKDKKINIYSISSSMSVKQNETQLNDFKCCCDKECVDIMISVDKLIEGLHLPTVSIAITLRKTKSSRVYFQQLGRIINDKQPIFFDLINNASHLYQVKREYEINIDKTKWNVANNRSKVMFDECIELIDETKDIIYILSHYIDNNKYSDIILNNREFIESQSGKLSYKKLSELLHISKGVLTKYIKKFNIKFKSIYRSKFTIAYIDKIISCNRDEIINMINNGVTLNSQAKKFNLCFYTYKNALIRNGIDVVINPTKFENKYDMKLFNEFLKLYCDENCTSREIRTRLNINKDLYLAFTNKAKRMKLEVVRPQSCFHPGCLTEIDKKFIIDNYKKYNSKELSEILGKSRTRIKDFKRLHGLIDENYIKNKIVTTEEQKLKIKELYQNNLSMPFVEIAKQVGVNEKVVRHYLAKEGLHVPCSHATILNTDKENRIISEYKNGVSKSKLEKKYHIGHKKINTLLEKEGINNTLSRSSCHETKLSKSCISDILNEYNNGLSKIKICKKYHIGFYRLKKILNLNF